MGKEKFTNGDAYIGEWQNGRFHGQGIMMYKDRQKLSGIWYNGSLDEKIDDKKILLL